MTNVDWRTGASTIAGFSMGLLAGQAIHLNWTPTELIQAALGICAIWLPAALWIVKRDGEAAKEVGRQALADGLLAKRAWTELGLVDSLDSIQEGLETAYMFRSVHPPPAYLEDLLNLSAFRRLQEVLAGSTDCSPEIREHAEAAGTWARRFLTTLEQEFPIVGNVHMLRSDASLQSAVLSAEGLRQSLTELQRLLRPMLMTFPVRDVTVGRLKRMKDLEREYQALDQGG